MYCWTDQFLKDFRHQPSHSLLIHVVYLASSQLPIHLISGIGSSHQRILLILSTDSHCYSTFQVVATPCIHSYMFSHGGQRMSLELCWNEFTQWNVVWAVSFFEGDISSVEGSHNSVLCIVSNNQPADSFSSTQPSDVSTAWVSPIFRASRSPPISSWLGALCILFYHRGKTFSLPIYD